MSAETIAKTRHIYATLLQKNGMPVAMVSVLMGHESRKTTAQT
jgi:integrase